MNYQFIMTLKMSSVLQFSFVIYIVKKIQTVSTFVVTPSPAILVDTPPLRSGSRNLYGSGSFASQPISVAKGAFQKDRTKKTLFGQKPSKDAGSDQKAASSTKSFQS
jgi:hypothetical protein